MLLIKSKKNQDTISRNGIKFEDLPIEMQSRLIANLIMHENDEAMYEYENDD